jgi:hypothetical protein
MRRRIGLWTFALLAVLAPRTARASECTGPLSPCVNDDTLWPHAGPARFVAVGSTDTVAPRQIGFALVTTYLSRPVILHVPSPGGAGSDQYAVNDQVNGTFLWSYGVADRLQLDLALPMTFGQGGTGLAPVTGGDGLKDTAVRDMRFGFAYALAAHPRAGDRGAFGLVGRLEVSAPTGDHDQFAGERTGVFVPSLAADYRWDRLFAGVEIGARLRPTTELLGARVGTQLLTVAGVGYDVLPHELLSASLEAWALSSSDMTPAEWHLAARSAPLRGGDLSIEIGGGGGIPTSSDAALTTPRMRFTLGVRWAPLARDSDGDGVTDAADACPDVAAPGTPNGCPRTPASEPAAPAVDLHLAGAKDVCTDEPNVVDGFKDDDGCPDEDWDKDGVPNRMDQCPLVPEDFVGLTDGCPEKK